jgi:hypothetical protein
LSWGKRRSSSRMRWLREVEFGCGMPDDVRLLQKAGHHHVVLTSETQLGHTTRHLGMHSVPAEIHPRDKCLVRSASRQRLLHVTGLPTRPLPPSSEYLSTPFQRSSPLLQLLKFRNITFVVLAGYHQSNTDQNHTQPHYYYDKWFIN